MEIKKIIVLICPQDAIIENCKKFLSVTSSLICPEINVLTFHEGNYFEILTEILSLKQELIKSQQHQSIAKIRNSEWRIVFEMAELSAKDYNKSSSYQWNDCHVFIITKCFDVK